MTSTSHLPKALQNLALPVIASPMFIASGPKLVAAQCKAGIVGSFPALNARPAELLDTWLTDLQNELAAYKAANPDAKVGPIAVNQIVHQSNDRLAHDVEVCVKHQVPIIISSLRAPPPEMLDAIHSYGGIVLHDVISIRHAQKALEAGVDGLILVAAGAGGHAGGLSPFALVGEVRKFFKGPIALSGSIATGDAILAALGSGPSMVPEGELFNEDLRVERVRPDGVLLVPPLSDDEPLLARLAQLGLPCARIAGSVAASRSLNTKVSTDWMPPTSR